MGGLFREFPKTSGAGGDGEKQGMNRIGLFDVGQVLVSIACGWLKAKNPESGG